MLLVHLVANVGRNIQLSHAGTMLNSRETLKWSTRLGNSFLERLKDFAAVAHAKHPAEDPQTGTPVLCLFVGSVSSMVRFETGQGL